MGIRYTQEQRAQMIERMKGKRIDDVEFVEEEEGTYWAATLDDGSEFCFRFMSELI